MVENKYPWFKRLLFDRAFKLLWNKMKINNLQFSFIMIIAKVLLKYNIGCRIKKKDDLFVSPCQRNHLKRNLFEHLL